MKPFESNEAFKREIKLYANVRLQTLNDDIEVCQTKKEVERVAARRTEIKLLLTYLNK